LFAKSLTFFSSFNFSQFSDLCLVFKSLLSRSEVIQVILISILKAMGLDPADPLLQLLRRSGAEVAGFGQLDETMQRRGWWIAAIQANCKNDMDFSTS